MSEPRCWKCDSVLELIEGRVAFRGVCDDCGAWLHCCRACKHYAPGRPNDCAIPDTDPIADREAANYCDEFVLAAFEKEEGKSLTDISETLFGDSSQEKSKEDPKDRFDDLFH